MTLEAFGQDWQRLGEKRVNGIESDAILQKLFENMGVKYVHVRSTTAGCYLFRVERAA